MVEERPKCPFLFRFCATSIKKSDLFKNTPLNDSMLLARTLVIAIWVFQLRAFSGKNHKNRSLANRFVTFFSYRIAFCEPGGHFEFFGTLRLLSEENLIRKIFSLSLSENSLLSKFLFVILRIISNLFIIK